MPMRDDEARCPPRGLGGFVVFIGRLAVNPVGRTPPRRLGIEQMGGQCYEHLSVDKKHRPGASPGGVDEARWLVPNRQSLISTGFSLLL